MPENWESYHDAWRWYRQAVRQVRVNSWRSFCESINLVLELTRQIKILAKDRGAIEELLRFPTGDLIRTPSEALGILMESHFPGATISRVLKGTDTIKTGGNSID